MRSNNRRTIIRVPDKRCTACGGKFGLIRHRMWRAALCSRICCERFRAREHSDRSWLGEDDAA